MKILITGSEGFLGRRLRKVLEAQGHSVCGLDLAAPFTSGEQGDILDCERVAQAVGDCDGIVHLAAISRVYTSERDPALCLRTNVDGTSVILDTALCRQTPPWMILASSREVYGSGVTPPVSESVPCSPLGVYGRSKLEAERRMAAAMTRGIRGLILRFSNVYGGWDDHPDRVIPSFLRQASAGDLVTVRGAGRVFDFLHIDDAMSGIVAAVQHLGHDTLQGVSTVNLSSGQGISLGDLARHITHLCGGHSSILEVAAGRHEMEGFVGLTTLASQLLGWRPLTHLADGLQRMKAAAPGDGEFARALPPAPGKSLCVLQVIHGYPMRYNAGSEVYTQTLCHGLADRGHQVHVFTREEDSFGEDFRLREESDPDDPRISLHVVNVPRSRDRYRHTGVDSRFAEVLDTVRPDVVHIGHLNHLSTSLVYEVTRREIPVIYTLHDYWVMCPRGQFMQTYPEDPTNLWAACDGQEDRKCADRCYARYYSGAAQDEEQDRTYWAGWVSRRMAHLREVAEQVDHFIAPARYLMNRYHEEFSLPTAKLSWIDYGFDRSRLTGRVRAEGEPFTFGYIGTHIPAKGIHQLIQAFGTLRGDVRLRIWGRPRGQDTDALKGLARDLPGPIREKIEWLPEYKNQSIVGDVFNRVDVIVVPSIWVENSPLVIHEAQQARVPVITADAGGMAEFVHHEVNGLLFHHRDPMDLAKQMQRMVDDPGLASRLGGRGYLYSDDGNIPEIGEHSRVIENLYRDLLQRRDSARLAPLPGPWRITFDTNPDDCNLKCIMCEEHSIHSPRQIDRKAAGQPPRRMPIDLIRRVLEDSKGTGLREIIPSTMGEPLLFEHFEEILTLCQQYGVKLNLTTNGTFPRKGAREWANLIVPVTSDVKISWNGATAATHEAIMVGTRWDKVLENVRTFIEVRDHHATSGGNRCRVTFQLTFLERNVAELPAIVELAADLGVDRVKGHHLWAHFEQIQGQSMRRNPDAITRWNEAVNAAREVADRRRLTGGGKIVLENIYPLDNTAAQDLAPGGKCPFLGQEAWVSAQGRFDPCCAPDTQRRTLGEFGDLNNTSIRDVWNGERYRSLVSSYRTRSLCVGCNMRRPAEIV